MARSSPYGDLLQGMPGMKLPDWVFGGEFGDIENDIIKTEMGRRQSEGQALQNDTNEFNLNQARDKQEFYSGLSDVFGENKPATMRDMYRIGVEQALGQGRADIAFQMQDKLDDLERQEKQQKIQDINTAIAAGRINPDYAATLMPELYGGDALSIAKERVKQVGGSVWDPEAGQFVAKPRSGGGKERQPVAYNKDGKIEWVDPRDTKRRSELVNDGWDKGETPPKQDPMEEFFARMMQGAKPAEKATEEQKQVADKVTEKLSNAPVAAVSLSKPPRPAQPGMKWQMNPKTGEFREVPL